MTIQQLINQLETRKRQCESTERDPDSCVAKKRMASKQLGWIEHQLDVLQKAAPRQRESRVG